MKQKKFLFLSFHIHFCLRTALSHSINWGGAPQEFLFTSQHKITQIRSNKISPINIKNIVVIITPVQFHDNLIIPLIFPPHVLYNSPTFNSHQNNPLKQNMKVRCNISLAAAISDPTHSP